MRRTHHCRIAKLGGFTVRLPSANARVPPPTTLVWRGVNLAFLLAIFSVRSRAAGATAIAPASHWSPVDSWVLLHALEAPPHFSRSAGVHPYVPQHVRRPLSARVQLLQKEEHGTPA